MKTIISLAASVVLSVLFFGFLGINLLRADERDPFSSIIVSKYKDVHLNNIILKGIIRNNQRAVAIINDELLMVGDVFMEYTIKSIDKDSVTIAYGDRVYSVVMPEETNITQKKMTYAGSYDLEDAISAASPLEPPLQERLSAEQGITEGLDNLPQVQQ